MVDVSFGDFQRTVEQVTRILPTAVVTGFHFVSSQISPDGTCFQSQRIAYAVFTAIFTLLCGILAVVDSLQAPDRVAAAARSTTLPNKKPGKKKPAALLTPLSALARNATMQSALRAVGSGLTFACIAIMMPPGPTCLFGPFGLPRWLTNSVCGTVIVLFGSLIQLPGFATTNGPFIRDPPRRPVKDT